MNPTQSAGLPFFRLRVLLEFEKQFQVFAAHCLETGNVITADDPEMAKEMIKELLEDEVSHAIAHKNLRNLFSSPAPLEVWRKWNEAAKANSIETITLNVSDQEIRLDRDEVESEVTFVQTAA